MSDNKERQVNRFKEVYLSLISLSVYRDMLSDIVISKLQGLLKYISYNENELEGFIEQYCGFYSELIRHCSKSSLKSYLIDRMLYHENAFTSAAERMSSIDKGMAEAASKDLGKLGTIADITSREIKEYARGRYCDTEYGMQLVESLPDWADGKKCVCVSSPVRAVYELLLSEPDWSKCTDELAGFHNQNGTGMFIGNKAFIWEKSNGTGYLRGVENPDPVMLPDLIGYEAEREEVITNTVQFLKGYNANNVLIYGDRGTGKSSTVKAILNCYHEQGLRVIEVPKSNLKDFPKIITYLKGRKQKFIIFVDDLVFEDSEENYTTLKAILEGGLETRPKNVLIYATSNRRHLIKEKFSDRAGLQSGDADDEIRAADTIQEKLSLADRFGITVVFSSPDKARYLGIVEGIAEKRGLVIEKEQLHKEALKWELWYNGRSPRTARQFVDWLEGQVGK